MSIGSWVKGLFTVQSNSSSDFLNPKYWLSELGAGVSTTAGQNVTVTQAMTLPVYFACVRAISEDVAKLPLITYERLERGKKRITDIPLYKILHDSPNPEMSAMSFRETMMASCLTYGNAYAEIVFDSFGVVQALYPIHPTRVQLKRNGEALEYYVKSNNGTYASLSQGNVFHIHGLGDTGIIGYSVAALAAESLGAGLAAQQYGSAFFGNGARPGGILEHPGRLSKEAAENLRKSWQATYSGAANSSKVAVLEEGMKWSALSVPPEDSQFLQTRQFQTEEICRWFRMPPHKIQHLLRSTFANIEHQALEYVTDALMPWCVRWEQEITRKLIPVEFQNTLFAEHLLNGLLRGDQAARASFYFQLFQMGAISPNEIREYENMNPIENGDEHFVQVNLTTLERAAEGQTTLVQAPVSQPKPQQEPPKEPQEEPVDEDAGMDAKSMPLYLKTHLRVFKAAADLVSRKEQLAVGRCPKKFKGDVSGAEEWVTLFYEEQRGYMLAAFRPIVVAFSDHYRLKQDECINALESAASAYALKSRSDVIGCIKADGSADEIQDLLKVWSLSRADELAGAVISGILKSNGIE